MADKEVRPFGMWPSPITPELLGSGLRLEDVAWDNDGTSLVWLEGRSDQNVLVGCSGTDAIRDLTDVHMPRGGVGYGGGAFNISHGALVFANSDGRLYRRGPGFNRPVPITPGYGACASPVISPDDQWVAYIHSADRKDAIALVDLNGHEWPVKLVQGADFYMQPVWHPDGTRLAWIEWNHPNMPWDGTRLRLGRLAGNPPRLTGVESIAGNEDLPVFQPAFSPDGAWLSYLTNQGEWDQLVVLNLVTGERRELVTDAVLMEPAWVQGLHVYGWGPNSQRLFYLRNDAGVGGVWSVDLASGQSQKLDFGSYCAFDQLAVSPIEERVAVLASGGTIPTRLITWKEGRIEVVRYGSSETIAPEDLPQPRELTWLAKDNTVIHAIYYPPTSSHFTSEGLPPAVVCIHGGPTGQNSASYSGEAAYFTTRGYAFTYVNYRGSTGYGRNYMLALRQRWGDLDVEDAVGCAQALVDQGLADPNRLVIRGGSAGGYTVYNALIRYPGRFKAGLCSFGVSNLFSLAMDTHKFEERYTDSMVGPLPEASARYREWSPIFHADRLNDPIAIFQGSVDKVVPPDQSESIVAVLRERKVPHHYRLFDGEGHGFRKRENIITMYDDIERFMRTYVLFG